MLSSLCEGMGVGRVVLQRRAHCFEPSAYGSVLKLEREGAHRNDANFQKERGAPGRHQPVQSSTESLDANYAVQKK